MSFCHQCGTKINDGYKFCANCGTPVSTDNTVVISKPTPQNISSVNIYNQEYKGVQKSFLFMGHELVISSGMDAFNYYRTIFKKFAKIQAAALEAEYRQKVTDLDAFFIEFPKMYDFYRKPLLDAAMSILLQSGIYDTSPEQFKKQHTADFCLCGEDLDNMMQSFNLTIEANQDKKAKIYNMMRGGIAGFAAAFALNVAVGAIAEADIRNANVTKKQRAELFNRINTEILMERAFTDYWRVFLSLTWEMNRKGADMWYPTPDANASAEGLSQNLISGMLPPDKIPDIIIRIIHLNPYYDNIYNYIRQHVKIDDEILSVLNYFNMNT